MKRFQFTLQALLTLRQSRENAALEHYGLALLRRQQALECVAACEREFARASFELQTALQRGCVAGVARQIRSTCAATEEQRHAAQDGLAKAEQQVQQTFAAMLETRREREVVDKLRDRQRHAYDHDYHRSEVRLLDELAQRRPVSELNWRYAPGD